MKSAADTATDPYIAAELHCRYAERRRVNNIHRVRISSIYNLEGYSGPGPFVPEGNVEGNTLEGPSGSEELFDEDDDVEDEVLRLGDFLDTLTI